MVDEFDEKPRLNFSRAQKRRHDGRFVWEVSEFHNEISRGVVMAGTTATVLTTPTGKKFHLRSISVTNSALAVHSVFSVYSSAATAANLKYHVGVASAPASVHYSGIKGPVFDGNVIISPGTAATGCTVSVAGLLDPDDDAR